jgi:hypothetical protein
LKRKLLLLDLVLGAASVYAAWQFRTEWRAAKARESALLNQKPRAAPAQPFIPLPPAPPVTAASYADVAENMLFDKSRNATVAVETPPPPPSKPMPALPVYHGVMNLGDGQVAIMSVTAASAQEEIRPGDAIGQFKLVDVNTEEIVFEWEGKTIHKKMDEILERAAAQQAAESGPKDAAPPPAPVQETAKRPTGPGSLTSGGERRCDPNDSSPIGTVTDGYRKMSYPTPFGNVCRWDPVGAPTR